MAVYGDILFLVNFSMDLLTLVLTAWITHREIKRVRLILGAGFGGFAGTLLTVMGADGFCGAIGNLLVMAVMTVIVFGIHAGWIRCSLTVCGAGTLLGGIMTVLLAMGDPVIMDYGRGYPSAFLGCTAAAWCFTRLLSSSSSKKTAQVEFNAAGEFRSFTALRDSGSFLAEPISGIPVIIASQHILKIPPERITDPSSGFRVRIIPVKTVTGEGALMGFLPDSVKVDGIAVRAVIAVDEGVHGGFDGIVPAGLNTIHKESGL